MRCILQSAIKDFMNKTMVLVEKKGVIVIQKKKVQKRKKSEKNANDFLLCVQGGESGGLDSVTSWFKAIRLHNLLEQMKKIDYRRQSAMDELSALTKSVEELIRSNRGGDKGVHGFIGERAQVFLANAWALIKGEVRICELIDDNGMTDYLEHGVEIQQKACRSGGWLGLDHIFNHREMYPDFSGKYQIPKDFYEIYERLSKMTKDEAGKLCRHDWNLWKEIQRAKSEGISIEPMIATYNEIQRDTIYNTIEEHKKDIIEEADKQERVAVESHRPTVEDCVKTATVSAAIEGVLTGTAKVFEKHRNGKSIKDYDKQDVKDVGLSFAEGSIKGAVRGTAVYLVENYTPVPGMVAGSAVTVVFDSAKAVKQYSDGELTGKECMNKIEKAILVASAGAAGAKLGGKICPFPILGEIIGGFVFSLAADKGFVVISDLIDSKAESMYLETA